MDRWLASFEGVSVWCYCALAVAYGGEEPVAVNVKALFSLICLLL